MRSIVSRSEIDDRTTRARIRDAAIATFAEQGVARTTARKVAAAAGVSAGLVIHHFGSMDGLRAACDEHIAAVIRHQKEEAMTAGPTFDVLAALREGDTGPMAAYLARILVDDSPAVGKLVDDLIADAEGYLRQGVEAGMLKPTEDPQGRAAVLAIWSLGALVLHRHLDRILGIDLADPNAGSDPAIGAYIGPAYEILGEGIFTEAFTQQLRDAFPPATDAGATTP
ncbi:MAG: TetR/AcrR family transcriptional regulator [Acidimicrobiia bacterium]|nr:TetR/AcrR family transcriptional regulator [Acidimicrobiia bacterium]